MDLTLDVDAQGFSDAQPELTYEVTVTAPDGTRYGYDEDAEMVHIADPQLWWPNGYGAQPLYSVRVELYCGPHLLDVWEKRIGLRTMTCLLYTSLAGDFVDQSIGSLTEYVSCFADIIPFFHCLVKEKGQKNQSSSLLSMVRI